MLYRNQGFIWGQIFGGNLHLFIRMYVRMYTHASSTAHVYPMTLEITLMHAACIYQFFFQNNDEDTPGALANYSDAMRGRYVCGMMKIFVFMPQKVINEGVLHHSSCF